jgi:hypothetical protein
VHWVVVQQSESRVGAAPSIALRPSRRWRGARASCRTGSRAGARRHVGWTVQQLGSGARACGVADSGLFVVFVPAKEQGPFRLEAVGFGASRDLKGSLERAEAGTGDLKFVSDRDSGEVLDATVGEPWPSELEQPGRAKVRRIAYSPLPLSGDPVVSSTTAWRTTDPRRREARGRVAARAHRHQCRRRTRCHSPP